MGDIEAYKAKQQELQEKKTELEKAQKDLDNKNIALENAKLENENQKSELINQLVSEIDNLNVNVEDYKKQIASINEQLISLNADIAAVENDKKDSTIDIYTTEWFLATLKQLLKEIDDIRTWISKKWLQKSWKKTMNLANKKLNEYEQTISWKINSLEKQRNPQISETDINIIKTLATDINTVRHDVSLWQWWEISNDASFHYNTPENARKANRQQEKLNQFESKLKQEVKDWAIKNIFGNNEQEAINFYRRIAEWRYTQTDYVLFVAHSNILSPSFKNFGIAIPTDPTITVRNLSSTPTTDYSNLERGETFQKWGIAWLIDKGLSNCKNMTPWQRTSRKNIAVLWCVAWWIYWLYKFFTNKKMSFWSKALTTGWVIFASQALTWEWPLALFNKLMKWWFSADYLESRFWNLFWEAVNWVWNSGIETIPQAMYSMMIFSSSTTVWEINEMTQNFKNDETSRKIFYEESINKLSRWWANTAEYFRTTFSDKFDEQKRNNWLASFWVVDISNPSNSNKSIYELANNASMNQIAIEKFKSENGVKIRKDKNKEFKEYVNSLKTNNKAIDIDELKKHPDWFEDDKDATYTERPEDENNKKLLVNKVDSLSLDNETKDKLRIAIQTFYDKRTIESKPKLSNFNLDINGDGNLVLESHWWYKTNIDLKKNELVWFGDWITFSILDDLLNTADLTNKILESQQSHTPKDMPPFQYKRERKWICFNNANSLRQDIVTRNNSWKDTRVLSTWRWWATSEIENLSRYPNEYAAYLSKRWEEEHQTNS